MKKPSILSSLSAAAVLLPALNHATPSMAQQDTKTTDISAFKKKYEPLINAPSVNNTPDLCIAPYVKKTLDLQTIKIFCVEGDPAKKDSTSTDPETAVNGTVVSTTGDGTVIAGDGTVTTGDESTTGDNATTGTDAESSEYDRHSVFGVDSKVFTRLTRPVKNLFADVAFIQTNIYHNNRAYNLNPLRPDPMNQVETINGYFEIPFTERMDIKATVGRDATTSATPFSYVQINSAGDVRQIVTGPSVKDQRNDGIVDLNYYGDNATSKLQVGASREYDYKSNFVGGETNLDINNKNTVLILGSSYTSNDVIPDQLGAVTPRIGGTNFNWQILSGLTQIIDNKSIGQIAVTYFLDKGYLRDPYKTNFVPDSKIGWSAAGRYIHYFPTFHEGSIDLNYRYYRDTWGVNSSTFKTIFRLALANGWGLEPGVRYYSQNGSKFYNLLVPPFAPLPPTSIYYTNLYQFASFGQISGLLQVNKQLSAANTIYVGGSYGKRRASLRLGGTKITNPHEPVFTQMNISEVYIGIKGVY
ncbi:DUF3570 domain-containing protein [Legionella quateirensis]|uniref:Protein of uncharacterized function (DUF3570) n=1 Tax=Legionella quateirensis TaxID=45072 RepID=A0A378KRA9_9GAMM|nr:DUF3570 domain-containing protein [Legionella quateirensis]KTD44636.1 hypothetical protein Lqua_2803 [Legionella quateirensis]STY16846.1 Protein of uncharacterised function (DUF3570) [Legionella quateirensis]